MHTYYSYTSKLVKLGRGRGAHRCGNRWSRAQSALRIGGDKEAETEVAGEAEGERAADRPREAQLEHAAPRVGLREVTLFAEAMACSSPLHAGPPQVKFRNLPTVRR